MMIQKRMAIVGAVLVLLIVMAVAWYLGTRSNEGSSVAAKEKSASEFKALQELVVVLNGVGGSTFIGWGREPSLE